MLKNRNYEDVAIIEETVVDKTGKEETKIKKYAKGKFLGKGGFAKVYELTDLENNKVMAAKIIPKLSLKKTRHRQKLLTEIKIHRTLQHQNIVKFEHVFEDKVNVYILLEMCTNNTLNELCKTRKYLSEFEVQYYLYQVVGALKYLHQNKIIHRDLKLGNLFLNEKLQIKLGDFGLATKLDYHNEKRYTVCGTPNYLAPEILANKVGHSFEVDIWSLGVVLYTLVVGKPPFETSEVKMTYEKIRKAIYNFPKDKEISPDVQSLIKNIFIVDPKKRPSLEEVLEHPFLNNGIGIAKTMHISTLSIKPNKMMMENLIGKDVLITPKSQNRKEKTDNLKSSTTHIIKPNDGELDVHVKKWVDYSSKYGIGYLLSNDCCGVYFNDLSKIIYDPKQTYFEYIEKTEKEEIFQCYYINDYPPSLQKKITLLFHFFSYLDQNKKTQQDHPKPNNNSKEVPKNKRSPPMVYLKKWVKTKNASLLRLSNKLVQVIFSDNTEIILSSENKFVTYVNKNGEKLKYPISSALDSQNKEMAKRLKYTKEILTHIINNKISK